MPERLRIFNKNGEMLTEFQANSERSWAINQVGRASFTIPRRGSFAKEEYIRFGNWVLIEHDQLPAWVGMIDTPRYWANQSIEVNCYEPFHIMDYRIASFDKDEHIEDTPGTLFKLFVNKINQHEQTPILIGSVDTSGQNAEDDLTQEPLYKAFDRFIGQVKGTYTYTPVVNRGVLSIYANYAESLIYFSNRELYQSNAGGNLENPSVTEDGELYNHIWGIGDGNSWGVRPKVTTRREEKIELYGLREFALAIESKTVQDVQRKTEELIKRSIPDFFVDGSVADVDDIFSELRIGAVLRVRLQDFGFDGADEICYIKGMSYSSAQSGKCTIVMDNLNINED